MSKRLCSFLLAAVLVGGMIPVAAAADEILIVSADSEDSIAESVEQTTEAPEAPVAEEETVSEETIGEESTVEEPTEEIAISESEETEEQTLDLGEAMESAPVEVISDVADITELIQDNWDSAYYGEITVDPKQNHVEKDGERISLRSELDLTKQEEKKVLASASKAETYFDAQPEFQAYTDNEGIVHVSNPYQTGRIVVYANQLTETYGASTVLYLESYGEYILQYDSEEQTRLAYEALHAQYGSACYLDQVLSSSMLLDDDSDSTTTEQPVVGKTVCYSWGAEYMGLDSLQDQVAQYGLTKRSVTVAVIDTGIDKNHSFFAGRKISGHNFLTAKNRSATNFTDDNGHGTHVAGIIADCTPTNVNIMALRVFDKTGETSSSLVIDNALKYAYEHSVTIVNMSLGNEDDITDWDNSLDLLHQAGIPVFAAAGNYSSTNKARRVNYPASKDTTFAISAVDESGNLGSYSCYGSAIDFAAPGTSILSAQVGSGERFDTGTSMAAPHASAAAAMIYLKHPNLSLTSLEQILKSYAVDAGKAGKDDKYGYGILKGFGKYYEEDSGNLVIKSANLKYRSMQYTGTRRKNPVVRVKASSGKVVDPENYTVTYLNNKAIGTATVRIKGTNGRRGTITKTFQIIPRTVSVTKLTNKAMRKMVVKWSPSKGHDGYQIQYATNADFTKGKHSIKQKSKSVTRTYSKLTKGKRYYVRVRAYKKVGSTTYYGIWSEAKSIRISK